MTLNYMYLSHPDNRPLDNQNHATQKVYNFDRHQQRPSHPLPSHQQPREKTPARRRITTDQLDGGQGSNHNYVRETTSALEDENRNRDSTSQHAGCHFILVRGGASI
jgi:hypothetical protein